MQRFAIKLALLLSFCGGPLFITDLLKPSLGQVAAFVATMAPVAIAGFCWLSLGERDPWGKVAAVAGALAVAALTIMNGFTIWQIATGRGYSDRNLIVVGIAAGTAGSLVYAWDAYRRLRV